MTRVERYIGIVTTTGLLAFAIQLSWVTVYYDGRCGAQKWNRWVLWMNYSEPEYDEGDIVRRWRLAHVVECEHIWIPGPLQPDDKAGYWPALHLSIAAGLEMKRLKRQIEENSDAIKRVDKLGRTTLHWAAIYPVDGDRAVLKEILARGGADPAKRDSDGLTAGDWSFQFERHK